MRQPVVELSDCILCGICTEVCAAVFSLSTAGYIQVAHLPVYPQEDVDEAIKNCPVDCIYWEEA